MGGDEEGVGQELRLLYLDSLSSFLDSRHRGPQNQNQNLDILQVLGQSDRKTVFLGSLIKILKIEKKKKKPQNTPKPNLFFPFSIIFFM